MTQHEVSNYEHLLPVMRQLAWSSHRSMTKARRRKVHYIRRRHKSNKNRLEVQADIYYDRRMSEETRRIAMLPPDEYVTLLEPRAQPQESDFLEEQNGA